MSYESQSRHVSVLSKEVLVALQATKGGDYLDCTLGGAGHTESILESNTNNTVFGCDRDENAILRAEKKLARFGDRFTSAKASFSELKSVCAGRKFDGLLADLGVSTDQLFENRGFSFRDDSNLDMRMDQSSEISAEQVVNEYSDKQLYKVMKVGGVGVAARAVTSAIIRARPITSTAKLAEVVAAVMAARSGKKKTHPATVVFQAIRMEVNQELLEIEKLLEDMPKLLKSGSRAAVICFHSGEDKLVAKTFRKWAGSEEAPAWWAGDRSQSVRRIGRLLQNEAQTPTPEEVANNAAARSAMLRVFIFDGE